MQPQHALIALATGSLALSSSPLSAQEKGPDAPPPPRVEVRPGQRPDGPDHRDRTDEGEVPTPFIGVVTRELEPEVRAQVGVPDGFGLLVMELMPDGPAAEAGLRQHDVLTRLDDQQLINVDQFMVLVRNHKKGDEVNITLKRAGAEQTLKVKVGERNLPPMRRHGHDAGFELPVPNGGRFRYEPPQGKPGPDWQDRAEKFRNQMREYQERIEEWARDRSDRPRPLPPRFEEMPRREGPEGQRGDRGPDWDRKPEKKPEIGTTDKKAHSSSSSVTMHGNAIRTDDTGIYSIRRENDRTTFSVKPKGGEEKSWPVNTPEEREAVPAELRERLTDLEKILREGQN